MSQIYLKWEAENVLKNLKSSNYFWGILYLCIKDILQQIFNLANYHGCQLCAGGLILVTRGDSSRLHVCFIFLTK